MASEHLERQDYLILERNYRCRYGEIDIIACNKEYLVFCEVKTRSEQHKLHPSLSVTQSKAKRIRELAGMYLMKNENEKRQPRFDVISIVLNEKQEGLMNTWKTLFNCNQGNHGTS